MFIVTEIILKYFYNSCIGWNDFISVTDVVTCEIKLFWNNFGLISVFYFTCNHDTRQLVVSTPKQDSLRSVEKWRNFCSCTISLKFLLLVNKNPDKYTCDYQNWRDLACMHLYTRTVNEKSLSKVSNTVSLYHHLDSTMLYITQQSSNSI